MMAPKPLLLKDYLDLDSDIESSSSSSSSGFSSFPRKPDSFTTARLIRSPSRGALTRLSALLKRLRLVPKKSNDDDRRVTVKDIVRSDSFDLYGDRYFPSPAVSSCSSCSDGEDGSGSFLSSSSGCSTDCFPDAAAISSKSRQSPSEEVERQGAGCSQSEEEKEQLSPVAVMDFPYQDDGDDEFEDESLANIERTAHQLLQKIRRFETIAELAPLGLELRFTSPGDDVHVAPSEEIGAWDLIRRLRTGCRVGPRSEKLLVDFFVGGLSCSASAACADAEGLLSTACVWINGDGCLKPEEHGESQLREMEQNGRWGRFEGGKEDVAAEVESGVLGALLQELVLDLSTMC